MNEHRLTPKKISNDLKENVITKSFAIELLFSIIDSSEDPLIREECIEAFRQIEKKDEKIFNLLENHLISDENPRVRNAAAKLIGIYYLDLGVESLCWSLSHDKSPIVLSTIATIAEINIDKPYHRLNNGLKELYNYISKQVGVITSEARFFLDLETIFARNTINYEMNFDEYKNYQQLKDFEKQDFWLRIEDRRVISLYFHYFSWNYLKERKNSFDSFSKLIDPFIYLNALKKLEIRKYIAFELPNSIGLLTRLKKLSLRDNGIENLPPSFSKLILLEHLDLSWNALTEIPESIYSLEKLSYLNLTHNKLDHISQKIMDLVNLKEVKLNDNLLTETSLKMEKFVNSRFNHEI
jgi:Leucine-rich repeat (LRR) protein